MASSDPQLKQLQVKVGTVKRTKREYQEYLKEEGSQREKIDKMKAEGADEADVKKQTEVLNDTLTVIPDTRQRLQKYAKELAEFMAKHFDAAPEDAGEASRDVVLEARQLLSEASSLLGVALTEEAAGGGSGVDESAGPVDEF